MNIIKVIDSGMNFKTLFPRLSVHHPDQYLKVIEDALHDGHTKQEKRFNCHKKSMDTPKS